MGVDLQKLLAREIPSCPLIIVEPWKKREANISGGKSEEIEREVVVGNGEIDRRDAEEPKGNEDKWNK